MWEGGDESTLDAAAYAKALKSYAKSPRARGENDATSSSSDDDDDDADADRPLEVGDKLLSRCGLVGTVEEISGRCRHGPVGDTAGPADRKSSRRAGRRQSPRYSHRRRRAGRPRWTTPRDSASCGSRSRRAAWCTPPRAKAPTRRRGGGGRVGLESRTSRGLQPRGTQPDSIDERPPAKTSRVTKSGRTRSRATRATTPARPAAAPGGTGTAAAVGRRGHRRRRGRSLGHGRRRRSAAR